MYIITGSVQERAAICCWHKASTAQFAVVHTQHIATLAQHESIDEPLLHLHGAQNGKGSGLLAPPTILNSIPCTQGRKCRTAGS
jgi:hypothetical protein